MTYILNEKEKAIINAKNGDVIRPSCFADLVLYHNYILNTDGEKAASQLLKRVALGEKVISNMIAYLQENTGVNDDDK